MRSIIASFFLLQGALGQVAPEQTGEQGVCEANAVDPASVLAAEVLPLPSSLACKIVEFDAVSKFNPAVTRWVDTRLSFSGFDRGLASDYIWQTEGQAHAWLSAAKTNVLVIVGSGIDDQIQARRCGQLFEVAQAIVLRGGVTNLSKAVPTVSAIEALSALLRAKPNTLTLVSSNRIPSELASRLRASAVRVERISPASPPESTAVIRLQVEHSKQTLRFNITGGIDALLAAYEQSTSLALAPKSEPRRPCYFP